MRFPASIVALVPSPLAQLLRDKLVQVEQRRLDGQIWPLVLSEVGKALGPVESAVAWLSIRGLAWFRGCELGAKQSRQSGVRPRRLHMHMQPHRRGSD